MGGFPITPPAECPCISFSGLKLLMGAFLQSTPQELARRAAAICQAVANWRQFRPRPYDASKGIQLGALVCLVDSDNMQHEIFLCPDGGSMKLIRGAQLVQVISNEAPLGKAMLGKCEGDEVVIQVVAPVPKQFEVLQVH